MALFCVKGVLLEALCADELLLTDMFSPEPLLLGLALLKADQPLILVAFPRGRKPDIVFKVPGLA
jgi:hypothetical protein